MRTLVEQLRARATVHDKRDFLDAAKRIEDLEAEVENLKGQVEYLEWEVADRDEQLALVDME